jgi:sphinganine-1-phosphate aldolase
MANAASKPSALIRFTQISSDVLDSRYLQHLKNIVFVIVLLNTWSKVYNKVLVGGPVRAFNDFKAYIIKVSSLEHGCDY